MGAYYLESIVKTVCVGPMIQWPIRGRPNKDHNGNEIKGRDKYCI